MNEEEFGVRGSAGEEGTVQEERRRTGIVQSLGFGFEEVRT